MAFDVRSESFHIVRIPAVDSGSRDSALIEYDGHIAILDYLG